MIDRYMLITADRGHGRTLLVWVSMVPPQFWWPVVSASSDPTNEPQ
jgi:hypothetical protein